MFVVTVNYIQAHISRTQRGAALVEYALLLALIAITCFLAVTQLGGDASAKYVDIAGSITK